MSLSRINSLRAMALAIYEDMKVFQNERHLYTDEQWRRISIAAEKIRDNKLKETAE